MSWPTSLSPEEERLRPLYARVLRLRHVDPGGVLCFVFFEGTVVLGLLLALAELVSWWGVLALPVTVAVMVKVNDMVAAAVVRSAARVPAVEQERFRREMRPVVGRAAVPGRSLADPVPGRSLAGPDAGAGPAIRPASPGFGGRLPANLLSAGGRPAGLLPAGLVPARSSIDPTAMVRTRLELVAGSADPDTEPAEGSGKTRSDSAAGFQVASGRPLNTHPIERRQLRPIRRWLIRLDPIDTARQRARQSAKRRYE